MRPRLAKPVKKRDAAPLPRDAASLGSCCFGGDSREAAVRAVQATTACACSIDSITWRTVNGLRRMLS